MSTVAPEATQESAPVESEAKEKTPARKQIKYPGLFDTDGNPVQLETFPEDYTLSDHKPFVRKDFVDETLWLEWRADMYEAKAKGYRDEAALIRQFGSTEDRKAAEKLIKMRKKFEELKAQLDGTGIDVEAILASVTGASAPEEVASEPTA